MMKFLALLSGKKTYLAAFAVGAIEAVTFLGYISRETATTLEVVLGAGGMAALRAGVTKSGPPQ